MPIWKQRLLARLHEQANDGSGQGEGTGGGATEGKPTEGKPTEGKPAEGGMSDNEARLLRENMQRKQANEDLQRQVTEMSAVLEKVKSLGGLDSLANLVQANREAEDRKLEEKGEWDRLRERMAGEHQTALDGANAKMGEIQKRLDEATKQINELTIGSAFSQSQFIKQDLVLPASKARVVFGEHFDLVDGKIVGYDKPRGAAKRTPLVDAQGNSLPFETALQRIVEQDPERDHLLRAKGKPGAASESRKETPPKNAGEADGLSKITQGLGSLNIKLN